MPHRETAPRDRLLCNPFLKAVLGVRCTVSQRCCNGTCKDVETDATNCGGCGNTCPRPVTATRMNCVRGACSQNQYFLWAQSQFSKCLTTFNTYSANSLSEATACAQNQYP